MCMCISIHFHVSDVQSFGLHLWFSPFVSPLPYDNKNANEKLSRLRDDIRRNKIFHKEYQIHFDPSEVVKQLGKDVYDPGDATYIPENEEGDLASLLVPIHRKLNAKAAQDVKEDAKPLVFDEEG